MRNTNKLIEILNVNYHNGEAKADEISVIRETIATCEEATVEEVIDLIHSHDGFVVNKFRLINKIRGLLSA